MAKRKRRAHGEGSLIRRKGCQLWYASYYKDGRQIRVSTGESVKQRALTVLRRLMGDSERGLLPITDLRKIQYADLRQALIDDYTARGNKSLEVRADGSETIVGLKPLDNYFNGWAANRITTDSTREFSRKRAAEGAGPAMINRSLQCLRRMLNIAREDGKLQTVPKIRLLKEPGPRKGFLEAAKFDELWKALPTHLRPLITLLYWCGVRLGEALQIEWTQVDPLAGVIRLEDEQTKTSEPRIVPLPSVLVDMLNAIEPKVGRVFDSTNLRTEWARACTAVGLGKTEKVKPKDGYEWTRYNGLIVHDLRRSAIRNLVNAGVPELVAMRISGHKTRAVFDRYHIVSSDDVTAAMKRVESASLSANLVQNGKPSGRKLLTGA